jgi:hypothetical protein
MVPCFSAAVVPVAKTIFTAEGVVVVLIVGVMAGVDVRVGGSGVDVSRGGGGVKVGGGVAVAASMLGRLQLINMTSSMARLTAKAGFLKGLYWCLVFILKFLLIR